MREIKYTPRKADPEWDLWEVTLLPIGITETLVRRWGGDSVLRREEITAGSSSQIVSQEFA